MTSRPLVRLLQLASPALPVGAYSYSQGLEAAVEARIVHDTASAQQWIGDVLELSIAGMEAPLVLRLHQAWTNADFAAVERWNRLVLASRESAELRAETVQMGYSLTRLLGEFDETETHATCFAELQALEEPAFPTAYLLVINKIDLAPLVGASLEVMERDAKKMRGDKPFVFTNLKSGKNLDTVIRFIETEGLPCIES